MVTDRFALIQMAGGDVSQYPLVLVQVHDPQWGQCCKVPRDLQVGPLFMAFAAFAIALMGVLRLFWAYSFFI